MASSNGSGVSPHRLRATFLIIAGVLIIFLIRLISLQIVQGADFQAQADENRLVEISLPAPRGVIYDRNGFQLVLNIPSFRVMITPALLPDSQAELDAIYKRLSEVTGIPADTPLPAEAITLPESGCLDPDDVDFGIRNFVVVANSLRPYEPWPLACDLEESTARILREEQVDLSGVSVEVVPIREYTTGALTSSLIGYLGPIPQLFQDFYTNLGFVPQRDKIGYAGIEVGYDGMYQEILAGRNGLKQIERDVAGQQIRELGTYQQPQPGNSLRLTIDTRLQNAAETALSSRIEFINRFAGEERSPLGAVIAMNPQTGEILAMVSFPPYENNRFAREIPTDYYAQLEEDSRSSPLTNHAISSEFPPGSTFKLVTAVGALNEGVIDPDQILVDPGKITIENKYFPTDPGKAKDFVCWKEEGHGEVDFIHGIAWSCNVYFYKIGGGYEPEVEGDGLGVDGLNLYAPALGYGGQLGIDLPAEQDGLIPNQDWKRINLGENWSTGDTYNSVVGQGFVAATPLQVLTSVTTIANGGRVMWPHVVKEILDGEGNVIQRYEPCILWDVTDGVITPTDEIGDNCPTLPDELQEIIQESRLDKGIESPDVEIDSEVLRLVQQGMRLVVSDPDGTAYDTARIGVVQSTDIETISSAGKTGTGEFCDEVVFNKGLCEPGEWPAHAWYAAFAPYENPEIAVIAFIYYGDEGALTSGPVVRQILEAYFELKVIDIARAE